MKPKRNKLVTDSVGRIKLVKDWSGLYLVCRILIPRRPKRAKDIIYVK